MGKKAVNFRPKENTKIGNKYIIQEYIDSGTFGTVWKAINLETSQVIALKIPKNQERGDETLSEGKRLLNYKHPNIIQLHWMGRVENTGIFVIEMEYFNGRKLSDDMNLNKFNNPKTFEQVFELYFKVLNAIKYLHTLKISHGDIKPQNIMIDGDSVKVTDFGTSKFIENIFINTVDGGGTWSYMAPEVAGSKKRHLNSDIYSLGVLLYQLLTGRTPHRTAIQLLENLPYPKPREINDNISVELEQVIIRALDRNPEERYLTVQDLEDDIRKAITEKNKTLVLYERSKDLTDKVKDRDWLDILISYYNKDDYESAELLLKNKIENNVKIPDVYYHLAYVYVKQGRYYDALKHIKLVNVSDIENIRQDAFEDTVNYLKARIYLELKEYDKSIHLYDQLVNKNPENIDYRYKLACVYALNYHEDKAIEILENINKETPGILAVVKKLGHAYDQIKTYGKARGYYNFALRLDPEDEKIKERLEIYKKYL
ncbi:Tetratricopeptide repeat-containing protein [Acetoanaerobium noterae]|uniref:Tetratricopeptide repeat-containing protein n=1 Tax=Acetoanaerobium noterae TaxID=745369 RepID=A0A1T5DN57_9FIRM|nr:serine/threonine-protein kinase [Acetoanaerobium noterae]SKB73119.1 Tetratricopeptide repeat-containing protein [Acetoanaerobium noterae]